MRGKPWCGIGFTHVGGAWCYWDETYHLRFVADWRSHREIWQERNGTQLSTYAFHSSRTAQTANLGQIILQSGCVQECEGRTPPNKQHCKSYHLLECKMKHVWNHPSSKKTRWVFCDFHISLRSDMLWPAFDPLLQQLRYYPPGI